MSFFFGFASRSQQHLGLLDSRNTLLSFLGTAQLLSVDLLPITWNPALKDVGAGGMATLHERSISRNLSLVFKRVDPNNFPHYTEKATEDMVYRTLAAEIATARHYEVVESDYLAHLEGVCWDIERGGKVWPVLVYEKARYGSLKSIVESPQIVAPTTLDVTAKLRICTHIARGLATLHHSAIVHGDIKPDNVIIFEDKKG
ncbi:hypothetical protein DM02DRAFT_656069 [Periconia macrospinosa]|uniref:Protein kinase domain-containing protein n=1 Tax=Periconia macrospinosa TaxID=97972 RepID=A0A2V1DNS0_9PLEO|nr:hypothetical protein DM02DRAFT_656069 [Periconia macrospinosa]